MGENLAVIGWARTKVARASRLFKKVSRWSRRMPLSVAVGLAVLTGMAIAVAAEWILLTMLRPDRSGTSVDVTKLAFTVVGGIGGVVALVIAYRRQRDLEQGRFVERFGAAAAQLGASDVAVRIAGVYAMAGVADESDGLRRQQCIDVLCGYLRLPYHASQGANHQTKRLRKWSDPDHEQAADLEDTFEYRQNDREVRDTIVRVIGAHLDPETEYSWSANDFDFRTAHLEHADFQRATFAGTTRFDQATFSGTTVFRGATFSAAAMFRGATFSGTAGFGDATFSGTVVFDDATFAATAGFNHATFSSARFDGATFAATAGFNHATFSGTAWFSNATFSGTADFSSASFSSTARFDATFAATAGFSNATFSGAAWFSNATFSSARFGEATFAAAAWFAGATFSDTAMFGEATFSAAAVFRGATFSSAAGFGGVTFSDAAWFAGATFSAAAVFRGATFYGTAGFGDVTFSDTAWFNGATFSATAVFGDATFSGTTTFEQVDFGVQPISFAYPKRWGPPDPIFDWSADLTLKPANIEPREWPPTVLASLPPS